MPGCVGVCTWVWNESNGSWDPGGYNTCESGCMCGPAPGQEGPYDGYVATVACQGTPGSTTTTSSSSSSSSSSSTTTSSTTSSTTTSTTTTSAPCEGLCTYVWFPVGTGYQWVLQYSTCTAPGCYCNPPGYSGSYYGQEGFGFCLDTPPTTTTTTTSTTSSTTTSTSTTSTAPPTTTTTSSTSSTTTTTTTEQPCTGTCTWRWYAELQKWIKISGGNGTCSTGCSCSYPAADGTTDGETATPSCKRLTCTKCCTPKANTTCCETLSTCCTPQFVLPKKLYLTFIDDSGTCPCLDGLTFLVELINTNSTAIAWRHNVTCASWNSVSSACNYNIVCSGTPTYANSSQYGPTLTLQNNAYGTGECIFLFYWAMSLNSSTRDCQMFASAIKNPIPFIYNYAPLASAISYDSTAVFPCARPINVTFSKIYFNTFHTYPCFGCTLSEGQHPITLVITE